MFRRGEAQDVERLAYSIYWCVSQKKFFLKQADKINRGHFSEDMKHARKSIRQQEKGLSILNFIINGVGGGRVHAPSACAFNISLKMWAPNYQCGLVNINKLGAHMAPGVLKLYATLPLGGQNNDRQQSIRKTNLQ